MSKSSASAAFSLSIRAILPATTSAARSAVCHPNYTVRTDAMIMSVACYTIRQCCAEQSNKF